MSSILQASTLLIPKSLTMPWAQLPQPTRKLEPHCPPASSGAKGWQVPHTCDLGQPLGGGETFLSCRLNCRCKLPTLIPGILRVKRKYSKHYYLILTLRENNFSEDYNCHRSLKSFCLPDWMKLELAEYFPYGREEIPRDLHCFLLVFFNDR